MYLLPHSFSCAKKCFLSLSVSTSTTDMVPSIEPVIIQLSWIRIPQTEARWWYMTSRNAPVARSQMNTVESLETPTTIGKYLCKRKYEKYRMVLPKKGLRTKKKVHTTQIGIIGKFSLKIQHNKNFFFDFGLYSEFFYITFVFNGKTSYTKCFC